MLEEAQVPTYNAGVNTEDSYDAELSRRLASKALPAEVRPGKDTMRVAQAQAWVSRYHLPSFNVTADTMLFMRGSAGFGQRHGATDLRVLLFYDQFTA